jgi:hypothetical protein
MRRLFFLCPAVGLRLIFYLNPDNSRAQEPDISTCKQQLPSSTSNA